MTATQLYGFTVTVTAGTLSTAPQVTDIDIGTNVVDRIRWRVPPGPRGDLGWALTMGGVAVIPSGPGVWIVADNESDVIELSGLPDTGAWQVTAYNTGLLDHSIYLYVSAHPVQLDAQGYAPLSLISGLSSGGQ